MYFFNRTNKILNSLTFGFILVFSTTLHAQVFQSRLSVDTLKTLPVWQKPADFNNDSYMEIMAYSKPESGNPSILLVVNKGNFSFDSIAVAIDSLQINALNTLDYDHDNDTDIFSITSIGPDSTYFITYLNQEDNTFVNDTIAFFPSSVHQTGFGDFDNNGTMEIAFVDSIKHLGLYFTQSRHIQRLLPDTLNIQSISDFKVADFNNDSWVDIFISAVVDGTTYQSGIFYNLDSLNFRYKPLFNFLADSGSISLADIDHNGFDDLLLNGIDSLGNRSSQIMLNKGDTAILQEIILPEVTNPEYFMADFNSDGLVDISISGDCPDSIYRHYLLIMDQQPDTSFLIKSIDTLVLDTIGYQRVVADFDVDGDLDLSIWNQFNGRLEIFENTTPAVNVGPGLSLRPVVFFGRNEMVIVWEVAGDDHTAKEGITYDLSLYKSPDDQLLSGGFDVATWNRRVPAYGYHGHNQVAFIRDPPPGNYTLNIQPIDNALFVNAKVIGPGSIGTVSICNDVAFEEIYVCDDNPIQLDLKEAKDPGPPAWYSYNQGYFDFHDVLTYQPKDSFDIVYAGIPGATSCLNYKTFFIHKVTMTPPVITADTLICIDTKLDLEINEKYDSVTWHNPLGDVLSRIPSVSYLPNATLKDTIIYRVFQATCMYSDTVFIEINKPEVTVAKDSLKIINGASVSLNASGTLSYQWHPPTWLDNTNIPNPLASPLETIVYEVIGWNIPDCYDTASVFIEVTNLAFAPNLFTPNNDGSNERFKVLNLGNPSSFDLKIFDRNGKMLFETINSELANSQGWDGTFKGNPVPEGVYFWKVSGNYRDGKPVLVNGKTDGVIHLMR